MWRHWIPLSTSSEQNVGDNEFTNLALIEVSQASKWNLDFKYFTGSSATGRGLFWWLNKYCKKLFMKIPDLSQYTSNDLRICLECKSHLKQSVGWFYITDAEPLKDKIFWNNLMQAETDWLNTTCGRGLGYGLLGCMKCAVIEDLCGQKRSYGIRSAVCAAPEMTRKALTRSSLRSWSFRSLNL